MGNFYVNISTKNAAEDELAAWLKNHALQAYVIPAADDYCTLYEQICDSQNTAHISNLLAGLTADLQVAAIAFLNHDDDLLAYELWSCGKKLDEYDSAPGCFDDAPASLPPEGGNAALLIKAMGNNANAVDVEQVLRSENDYLFAVQRHQALVKALGMNQHGVGLGYNYIANGELPRDVNKVDVLRV